MWRLPKVEGLELAGAFMSHAASLPENDSRRQYHHTIARRILDGYTHPAI
jgi:hypothetical protein